MKDIRGNKSNNKKRIGIALLLLVLAAVAAIVLHKRDEPEVIGKLSKNDVAEISKVLMKSERKATKWLASRDLRKGDFGKAITEMRNYAAIKISSLELDDSGEVIVAVKFRNTEETTRYIFVKAKGLWRLDHIAAGWNSTLEEPANNG